MQVEIIGPDGKVHYTRPANHPDIDEALKTPGYSVRGMENPALTFRKLLVTHRLKLVPQNKLCCIADNVRLIIGQQTNSITAHDLRKLSLAEILCLHKTQGIYFA